MFVPPCFFVPTSMLAQLWGLGMGMLWLGLREAGLIAPGAPAPDGLAGLIEP